MRATIDRASGGESVGRNSLERSRWIFTWWDRLAVGSVGRSTLRSPVSDPRGVVGHQFREGAACGCARTAKVCREILEVEEHPWTFAEVEGVAPDDNAAGRASRHGVIWRKPSLGTRMATRLWLRCHSVNGYPAAEGRLPANPTREAWELVPDLIVRQLEGRANPAPATSSAPSDHALMMLVRLLGEIHRDHLEVAREEMEQIRRLNREMGSLSAQLPRPGSADRDTSRPASTPDAEGDSRSVPEDASLDRPAPQMVQAMVGERLAAWEKERQSRWRKVMGLLVKP